MGVKTKKIKAAGRFGAGYGRPKNRLIAVEAIQRKRQSCPFCKGNAKRKANGIWNCKKCGKTCAGHTYFLEKEYEKKIPQPKENSKEKGNF